MIMSTYLHDPAVSIRPLFGEFDTFLSDAQLETLCYGNVYGFLNSSTWPTFPSIKYVLTPAILVLKQ